MGGGCRREETTRKGGWDGSMDGGRELARDVGGGSERASERAAEGEGEEGEGEGEGEPAAGPNRMIVRHNQVDCSRCAATLRERALSLRRATDTATDSDAQRRTKGHTASQRADVSAALGSSQKTPKLGRTPGGAARIAARRLLVVVHHATRTELWISAPSCPVAAVLVRPAETSTQRRGRAPRCHATACGAQWGACMLARRPSRSQRAHGSRLRRVGGPAWSAVEGSVGWARGRLRWLWVWGGGGRLYPVNYHATEGYRAGDLHGLTMERFELTGQRRL